MWIYEHNKSSDFSSVPFHTVKWNGASKSFFLGAFTYSPFSFKKCKCFLKRQIHSSVCTVTSFLHEMRWTSDEGVKGMFGIHSVLRLIRLVLETICSNHLSLKFMCFEFETVISRSKRLLQAQSTVGMIRTACFQLKRFKIFCYSWSRLTEILKTLWGFCFFLNKNRYLMKQ